MLQLYTVKYSTTTFAIMGAFLYIGARLSGLPSFGAQRFVGHFNDTALETPLGTIVKRFVYSGLKHGIDLGLSKHEFAIDALKLVLPIAAMTL